MIVTVFRNRLRPDNQAEYFDTPKRMSEIARTMPGYLSHKSFTADDGERVTIVEFTDEASQKAWATQARHVEAKARGREAFYSAYSIQICTVTRGHRWTAEH
jgi:heme-degrading monooxygenase HmoA